MSKQHPNSIKADEALQALLDGNKRFVSGNLLHPNHCKESRQAKVQTQEPIAAIISCADARVPPVDLFDQGIGDLFVVRVAGNVIGDHTLGSLEYAVCHLHTPLIVVMGHSSCGAVEAISSGAALGGHMASLGPAIQAAMKNSEGQEGDRNNNTAKELAKMIADKIATSEPIIADYVKEGKVKVVAAYYDLKSGEVALL